MTISNQSAFEFIDDVIENRVYNGNDVMVIHVNELERLFKENKLAEYGDFHDIHEMIKGEEYVASYAEQCAIITLKGKEGYISRYGETTQSEAFADGIEGDVYVLSFPCNSAIVSRTNKETVDVSNILYERHDILPNEISSMDFIRFTRKEGDLYSEHLEVRFVSVCYDGLLGKDETVHNELVYNISITIIS